MDTMNTWDALSGKTPEEKLGTLGIQCGMDVDLRMLDEINRNYGIEVFLFFEEDLARTRTLESVIEEFEVFPEYGRPYVSIGSFLRFTRDNDPSFEQTMREFPLMIQVVNTGTIQSPKDGTRTHYITGLMPFLDELNIDEPLPE
jgi:hypothetical protein